MNEEINASDISVYPNPATDKLIVSSPELVVNKIEIYNSLGEKVLTQTAPYNVKPFQTTVNVSSFSSGIYFLKLKSKSDYFIKKIIIE
jgi:hypothetical protein